MSFQSLKAQYNNLVCCQEQTWDFKTFSYQGLRYFIKFIHKNCNSEKCLADITAPHWRSSPGVFGVRFKEGHTTCAVVENNPEPDLQALTGIVRNLQKKLNFQFYEVHY